MKSVWLFLLVSILLLSRPALALTLDANVFYFTDDLTAISTAANQRMAWDFSVMLNLSKKGGIVMGWSYASMAATDEVSTATTEYTSTEMGPRVGFYFDKNYTWSVFATYNLVARADFASGSTAEEWRGTTLRGELGYMPMATETLLVGAKLIYYKAAYNEQITGSTTLATSSYGRGMIYPAFALTYRFD